jgi:hypothetical protein
LNTQAQPAAARRRGPGNPNPKPYDAVARAVAFEDMARMTHMAPIIAAAAHLVATRDTLQVMQRETDAMLARLDKARQEALEAGYVQLPKSVREYVAPVCPEVSDAPLGGS